MRALCALACLALAGSAHAQARPTPLLKDDLQANKRTRIDAPRDSLDAALDDALGGPAGFSTKALDQVGDRIRAELKATRPRATPRVILFLYPGKISAERLKALSEIHVDIELVMDPCERTVCREAVAKHVELVGRAIGRPVVSGPGYKLVWKTVTLKTSVQMHDAEVAVYQLPAEQAVAAAKVPGGGLKWLDGQARAEEQYEPIVTKAIARRAAERRVRLSGPPQVSRSGGSVGVRLRVHGDRARVQQQALDAFSAAALGLRDNPRTPADGRVEVAVEAGRDTRQFRAPAAPLGLYVDRRLDGGALWTSYVEEVRAQAGATRLGFDDAEARGGALDEAGEPNDDEVVALLAQSFGPIAACARAEAARAPSFRGVTLSFRWLPEGRADGVQPKEPALRGGALASCLKRVVESLRLPRFSGGARTIEYPIRLK